MTNQLSKLFTGTIIVAILFISSAPNSYGFGEGMSSGTRRTLTMVDHAYNVVSFPFRRPILSAMVGVGLAAGYMAHKSGNEMNARQLNTAIHTLEAEDRTEKTDELIRTILKDKGITMPEKITDENRAEVIASLKDKAKK